MRVSGVVSVAPGPALATVLAGIDRTQLCGADLAAVVSAQGRQVAHEQARLMADMEELARAPWDGIGTPTREQADEFSADQVALALCQSRGSASAQLGLAQDLIGRLPMVHQAMLAGRIDYSRAKAFSDLLTHVPDDDLAQRLATHLLDDAARLTADQLRGRLRYQIDRADPAARKRAYRTGIAQRRLWFGQNPDGTAQFGATNLPLARAAAAEDRIDRHARAAKAAGDSRTLDQLRVDFTLDQLSGTPFDLHPSLDPITAAADRTARADDDAFRAGFTTTPTPTTSTPAAEGQLELVPQNEAEWADYRRLPQGEAPPDPDTADPCPCHRIRPSHRRGTVDLVVNLTALMGLVENPAIVPGWGPVTTELAAQIAHDQDTNPAWYATITNDDGTLLRRFQLRRRPTNPDRALVNARDQTCRFPGCVRRATRCDQDHRTPWARGGPTEPANTCVLCRHHHRLKHEKHLTVHPLGSNAFVFQGPDGRLYIRLPDGDLRLIAGRPGPDGWDLDKDALPPTPVTLIVPTS